MVAMRIDAHQHFWDYDDNPGDFAWIGDDAVMLRGKFGPAQLKPLLEQSGMDGCISVQARPSRRETEYLLQQAELYPFILGVVGWVDLSAADAHSWIANYSRNRWFKGVRLELPEGLGPDRNECLAGAQALAALGKTIDVLLGPHQLRAATELADRLPGQPIVINHLAKPDIGRGSREPWRRALGELARRPNVYCKLSAMITQHRQKPWNAATIVPYLDDAIEFFGAQRLMFGSDWPVCTIAADYATTTQLLLHWASHLSQPERDAILGQTCKAFYRL